MRHVRAVIVQQEQQIAQAPSTCGALVLSYESLLQQPIRSRADALVQLAEFIGLSSLGGALSIAEARLVLAQTTFSALKKSGLQIVARGGAPGAPKLRQGAAGNFVRHMDDRTLRHTDRMMRKSPLMAHLHPNTGGRGQ
mmetsp:Transcript_25892/g.59835  ORF Transcript_25892/g.59835 Transcript_25892/m.59835 type:complete len:139 (+) Transcript_25892:640-1056(+)